MSTGAWVAVVIALIAAACGLSIVAAIAGLWGFVLWWRGRAVRKERVDVSKETSGIFLVQITRIDRGK